jgi:pilus assembly protein Flp/PilA
MEVPDSYFVTAVRTRQSRPRRPAKDIGGNEVELGDARTQLREAAGQGLAEYALILGLIAMVVIAALTLMGTSINSMLSTINAVL